MIYDPLLHINDRLISNKSLIIYQKQEITKAKATLEVLQRCAIRQNEAFNKCVEEERELEAEITRRILINQKEEQLKCVIKEKLKRKPDSTIKRVSSSKRCKMIPNQLDIPQLRNKTIHTMFYQANTGDLYIGGSEGTLLMHNSRETRVYDTDLEGDILHIKVDGGTDEGRCLAAVARNKLYVFDIGHRAPRHVVDIEEIKSVHFHYNIAFITFASGRIDKFTPTAREVTVETVPVDFPADFFIPSSKARKYGVATPQNSTQYIVTSRGDEPPKELRKVDLTTVIRGFTVKRKTYLCHSDNKVWLLTEDYNVSDELEVEHGVKFLDLFFETFVIVDRANTLGILYYAPMSPRPTHILAPLPSLEPPFDSASNDTGVASILPKQLF